MTRLAQETEEALVVVAKYPQTGEVKTRLARQIGEDAACRLYRAFLFDLKEKFSHSGRPLLWAFTPPESPFARLIEDGQRCFPQHGDTLGERLLNIFRQLIGAGPKRVVVMSSDAPHTSCAWIDEAFDRLKTHDLVLGPADDGGYNFVGMRAVHDLFSGIRMSTGTVLAETVARAEQLGLTVHLLPASFDVDGPLDLLKLDEIINRENGVGLKNTKAVLETMRHLFAASEAEQELTTESRRPRSLRGEMIFERKSSHDTNDTTQPSDTTDRRGL